MGHQQHIHDQKPEAAARRSRRRAPRSPTTARPPGPELVPMASTRPCEEPPHMPLPACSLEPHHPPAALKVGGQQSNLSASRAPHGGRLRQCALPRRSLQVRVNALGATPATNHRPHWIRQTASTCLQIDHRPRERGRNSSSVRAPVTPRGSPCEGQARPVLRELHQTATPVQTGSPVRR